MTPEPEWLRRTILHLPENRKMGLVKPPQVSLSCKPADRKLITLQNFYNVSPGDLLRQDLLEFHQLAEVIHDTLGPAGCSVSEWVAQRKALDQVYGFPTDTLSEDMMLLVPPLGRWVGDCLYKC
jgi:hypothetical protein